MALLASTFHVVVGLPWSTFELLDWALQWSAMPVAEEEPMSEMWAEDLFSPCSSKCLANYDEDVTDSSGSEMYDDEVEEEDDSDWSCSEDEEELKGFSFDYDGDVDFWGDRWFWSLDDNELVADAETSSYVMERFVDYVMPSMDFNTEEVDVWIEKYGSSRSQVRFVTLPLSVDSSAAFDLPTTCTSIGLFVAVL
ncbi:hypothetical protein P3T76_011410 [Phytophthora citrophthora]|uniref:Uncharacterized protein n=1 Tax=Phytophthora citrophthora TaxID=4793 RepID=A0AAD9LFZ5_9STRA|nr:hypothetical protein P3T76_011410 [Phytophthora citrophthora]